jgi:hypothetical protein
MVKNRGGLVAKFRGLDGEVQGDKWLRCFGAMGA